MKLRDIEIQKESSQHGITIEHLPHRSDMPYRIVVGNDPVNKIDPLGLIDWSISGGYGGTMVAGWGKGRTWGGSGGCSLNVSFSGISAQCQFTEWLDFYGAYVGWGRQAGIGVDGCPIKEGFSASDRQYTLGGGAGWRAGGDISLIGGSDSLSLSGGAGRTGNAYGEYIGEGQTITFQYKRNWWWK